MKGNGAARGKVQRLKDGKRRRAKDDGSRVRTGVGLGNREWGLAENTGREKVAL